MKVPAHRSKHSQREFRTLLQQVQEWIFGNEKHTRLLKGTSICGIPSIFNQGSFRKAFARVENMDNLHFTRSIDAMDADRALVHHVKADTRRALAAQSVALPKPFRRTKLCAL
jgi:hypothetical protein